MPTIVANAIRKIEIIHLNGVLKPEFQTIYRSMLLNTKADRECPLGKL